MSHRSTEIAIIGAGVIGLSIAYRLAQSGRSVMLCDAGLSGQASSAAAGMLAPLAESNSLPALTELGMPSLRRYPDFLAEIEEVSGVPIRLYGPGILRVASTDAEAEHLCSSVDRQSGCGFPLDLLTTSEARAIEPALSPDVRLAIHSPAEKHVPPILLLHALRRACAQADVQQFLSGTVRSLRARPDGWTIATESVELDADVLVAAAGAWTGKLLRSLGIDLPISPLKGQICSVRFEAAAGQPGQDHTDGNTVGPKHTIYGHNTYIVPRPGGEIVIGATEEPEAGFSLESTEDAITCLRDRAAGIIPSLADARLEEARVGFRPASPDRLPIIGKLPGYDNGYIASGHGRNGILLTPITADIVRDMIMDGISPPVSVDPLRFATRLGT